MTDMDRRWKMGIAVTLKIAIMTGLLILLFGCAPKLLIKDDPSIKEIAVCTHISAKLPDSLKKSIDSITGRFIEDYNSENRNYKLIQCQNDSSRTLFMDVLSVRITDPGTQAGGVVVTTLGAITPFVMLAAGSPIIVWFAYLPRSSIQAKFTLSKDISEDKDPKTRSTFAGSGKYFGSYKLQKDLLFNGYYNSLKKEIRNIETRYGSQ